MDKGRQPNIETSQRRQAHTRPDRDTATFYHSLIDGTPWIKFEFGKCMSIMKISVQNRQDNADIMERIVGTEVSLTMNQQQVHVCGTIG